MDRKEFNKIKARVEEIEKMINGGKGSGNFGHAGREGKVGGSAPSGYGSSKSARRLKDLKKAEEKALKEFSDYADSHRGLEYDQKVADKLGKAYEDARGYRQSEEQYQLYHKKDIADSEKLIALDKELQDKKSELEEAEIAFAEADMKVDELSDSDASDKKFSDAIKKSIELDDKVEMLKDEILDIKEEIQSIRDGRGTFESRGIVKIVDVLKKDKSLDLHGMRPEHIVKLMGESTMHKDNLEDLQYHIDSAYREMKALEEEARREFGRNSMPDRKTFNAIVEKVEKLEKLVNGGKGSGNFGHSGRPGEVGGSAATGSSSSKPSKIEKSVATIKKLQSEAKEIRGKIEDRIGQKMAEDEAYSIFDISSKQKLKFFHGEDGTEYIYDKERGSTMQVDPQSGDLVPVEEKKAGKGMEKKLSDKESDEIYEALQEGLDTLMEAEYREDLYNEQDREYLGKLGDKYDAELEKLDRHDAKDVYRVVSSMKKDLDDFYGKEQRDWGFSEFLDKYKAEYGEPENKTKKEMDRLMDAAARAWESDKN